jgi:tetratricopeptide (TPR) repeat protein
MTLRTWRLIVLFISLVCLASPLWAQQSDTYNEEYDLYQKARGETDQTAQVAVVMEFIQKYEKSELDEHVSYLYAQYLDRFRQAGQWERMGAEAEKFLRHRPTDKVIAGAATEAYQKMGQPGKMVQFGTRLYGQAPSASSAYLVAKAYQSMGDSANFEKWAERTLRHAPNNAEMLLELINSAWRAQDLQKAARYGERALKGLAGSGDDKATNQARAFCYRAIAENAYMTGEMSTAQTNFEKAAELDPMVDFAHHRLGYCYWRSGKVDQAIQSFARAVAADGSSSREARKELYNLLRQRYGNTSNAAKIIKAAEQELGI